MNVQEPVDQVREILQQFQDGYASRDINRLDLFMALFVHSKEVELIGIGAFERSGYEWFEGVDRIREIIQSDWQYWGKVDIDVAGAKIHVNGEVAWLTTTGTLEQNSTLDSALPFYLDQMKEFIIHEDRDPQERLMEATHYGMRRIWERSKGDGHQWPFVFSAVLQKEESWRFHMIHWSMPVD